MPVKIQDRRHSPPIGSCDPLDRLTYRAMNLMATDTQPGFEALIDLYEQTRRNDPEAKSILKDWFDARTAAMRRGKEAREELGTLAYFMAEKEAERKLGPKGKYNDLQNDPSSIASRHWQRFQPFFEDIEKGKSKSVHEFVGWVGQLTEFVFRDVLRERSAAAEPPVAIDGAAEPVEVAEDDGTTDDYPRWLEEKRGHLRQVFEVLKPRQFIVLILKEYCDFTWTSIAEILGTTVHYVEKDYEETILEIGRRFH